MTGLTAVAVRDQAIRESVGGADYRNPPFRAEAARQG
jgi:hypothetical protein